MIEAGLTFLLIMSVAYGTQVYTSDFIMEETIDLQADRFQDTATALDNLPEGQATVNMRGYEFMTDGMEMSFRYEDTVENRTIEAQTSYGVLEGPSSYEDFDVACIEKTGETLSIDRC